MIPFAPLRDGTMASLSERSPAEWFAAAARSYIEGHQACAWCGNSYCVFQVERCDRREYSCNDCNFYVCHDHRVGTHHVSPGDACVLAAAPAGGC